MHILFAKLVSIDALRGRSHDYSSNGKWGNLLVASGEFVSSTVGWKCWRIRRHDQLNARHFLYQLTGTGLEAAVFVSRALGGGEAAKIIQNNGSNDHFCAE